jgi:hypothetical protein
MIHTQHFFIAGIDDAEEARTSAFGAMFCFLVTFVASLGGIWYDAQSQRQQYSKSDYDDYPSNGSETDYQLQTEPMATYGTSA